tara:strand:- start:65 stop:1252 length:1188 start_codon:yes stop_codon:yes gene_type:complete
MRVRRILQDFVGKKLAAFGLRSTKIKAITDMTLALLNGSYLTLTSLGEHCQGSAKVKHKIKRVDRWLGNDGLYECLSDGYKTIFNDFLSARKHLDILVDWSGCCNWHECCIRASLVCSGRSITIYQEVHSTEKQQKPEVHRTFLKNLRAIIPAECHVTIITDRGFQLNWFEMVTRMGWDFIGRANQHYYYQIEGSCEMGRVKELYAIARKTPKVVGRCFLGKSKKLPAYVHTYKGSPKKRKYMRAKNRPSYPALSKTYSTQNKTPWVIVTSHAPDSRSARQIINNYHSRMQIEQNFRDDKSERFGYGFSFGRTRSVKRLSILLFIAAICSFLLMLIGAAAEANNLHRSFQANSVKNRRVLSLLTLAKRVLRECINSISRLQITQGFLALAMEPQL